MRIKFSASDFLYVIFGLQMAVNVKYLHDNIMSTSKIMPELHYKFFWLDIGLFGLQSLLTCSILLYAWYLERIDNDKKS